MQEQREHIRHLMWQTKRRGNLLVTAAEAAKKQRPIIKSTNKQYKKVDEDQTKR